MTTLVENTTTVSVIVPVYNEEEVIAAFFDRLQKALDVIAGDHEVIFVNDGSVDGTLEKVVALSKIDPRVRVLSLSRNFGHQLAITAGLDRAGGDAVVVIDSDLQDPPEIIGAMVEKWKEGFDVVYGVRERRDEDTYFKLLTAKFFYRFIAALTDVKIPSDVGDFRLMSRRAVTQLNLMRERHRFVRGMAAWVGFRSARVLYARDARYAGTTKYPLPKMIAFAIDAIVSFSDKPLRLASYLGFAVSGLSVPALIYFILFKYWPDFFGYVPMAHGVNATIVSMFFLGGVQLICLGIIGEYLGRIYDEMKQRPLYIVADDFGFEDKRRDA